MNLQPLFKTQRELDAKILLSKGLVGHYLLDKKILALQVELGELANEWRGFKFWSEDQLPKPPKHNWRPSEDGMNQEWLPEWGYESYPLLEEYVDCLHFILSIGNEIKYKHDNNLFDSKGYCNEHITDTFLDIYSSVHDLYYDTYSFGEIHHFEYLILQFVDLGEQLGFTWNEVEQAYYKKNEINHERQVNGY